MTRYVVRYSPRAVEDLDSAHKWGVENWGEREADEWLEHLDNLIARRLSLMPLSCPLAPEDPGFEFELRQLSIHRYRILFRVEGKGVFVLRVRGPFSGGTLEIE